MPFVLALAFTLLTGTRRGDGAVFRRRRGRDASRPIDLAASRRVGHAGEPPRTGARQVLRDGDRARPRRSSSAAGGASRSSPAFLLLEQYGAESTKAIFKRPRPSRDLISTFGNFSGYTFPSTTITFFSVTFGALGVVAMVRKNAPMRQPVMWISFRHGAPGLPGASRARRRTGRATSS